MPNDRPNPDDLLARVNAEESPRTRGKLRIFFGYAAGVGKTYAMLEAARREKATGVDVVVGYVEPHGRAETEALLDGLESIPTRTLSYRGVSLQEFDLDAVLQRKPKLVLVDELAHTNADGSRHVKRWQDVDELLEAGIDVYSSLNVQHVESLNDVIAQITGVIVRETLPDAVLEKADEVELIDLTPEELVERLDAGKIYRKPQAERAIANFFQKSNLTALRELSLRRAADRLHREVDAARKSSTTVAPWATRERLLVCVSPSPTTSKLIRATKRMAEAQGAEWIAVAVTTRTGEAPTIAEQRLLKHLQLADRLGAETHTLIGEEIAATIVDYARSRNVTRIIVGKTAQPHWRRLLRGTVVHSLLEISGDIDVHVIRGEVEIVAGNGKTPLPSSSIRWGDYAKTLAIVAACGLACGICSKWKLAEANIVMIFLLGVVLCATRYGRGPATASSIASVLAFDYFFVEPYYSFSVYDAQYLITFAVMLGIGLLISTLTAIMRGRLIASQIQERRTAALYRLTRQLSEVVGAEFLLQTAGRQLTDIFKGEIALYLRDAKGNFEMRFGENTSIAKTPVNRVVAEWVAGHDRIAGLGTDTLPNATALFVPLIGSQRTVGVMGVKADSAEALQQPDQRRLLEACASLIALSIERDESLLEAQETEVKMQAELLRNSLLSSVSHDLRTPLAAIAGSGSSLLSGNPPADTSEGRELLHDIVGESQRLTRLVENLLDMTRLEAGALKPNKQWHVFEELIGSARNRLKSELVNHPVHVEIHEHFPLLYVDGLLMDQVIVNLLENACRYTPAGTRIGISASVEANRAAITFADDGPGFPSGAEERIFEKFFRGGINRPDGRRGVGLGLAICAGIIKAHGGRISARNRPTGGAEFRIELPLVETPPVIDS